MAGEHSAATVQFLPKLPQIRAVGATKLSVNSLAILARALQFLLPDLETGNKVE